MRLSLKRYELIAIHHAAVDAAVNQYRVVVSGHPHIVRRVRSAAHARADIVNVPEVPTGEGPGRDGLLLLADVLQADA